ncbi:hypothetical protein BDZ45DRAFT_810156 [Acephala macrosclerotiorum]|nr:hypothetical protein BDZ45DRAFT_810156 [Acephala macrosclerotiorum]
MSARWTLTSYLDTHPLFRPPFEQVVLDAVKAFVQVYPLGSPGGLDKQPHTRLEPYEPHGIIVLPLWEQRDGFKKDSPGWKAFNILLDTLAIAAHFAAEKVEADQPGRYRLAVIHRNVGNIICLGRGTAITPRTSRDGTNKDCFQSVRLSANIALEPAKMTTFHRSSVAAVMVLGSFRNGGEMLRIHPERGRQQGMLSPGKIGLAPTAHPLGATKFDGERYQLDFFMPELVLDLKSTRA